jgi:glycosyltransferase involved in cell wall biosynthesis
MKLSIIIPSRNRPELLPIALASLTDQSANQFEILVSDNSSEDIAKINAAHVASISDSRLRYVRPPKEMSMVEHWNWAVQQASGDYIAFLTDRMLFKIEGVKKLIEAIDRHRPNLMVYFNDRIKQHQAPYILERSRYTEDVHKLNIQCILDACKEGMISRMWPRMLNSIISRSLLSKMQDRYGAVFTGIVPDYSFCFQAIELVDSFYLMDARLFISAGHGASNGNAFYKNQNAAVSNDFVSLTAKDVEEIEQNFYNRRLIDWRLPVPYLVEHLEYLHIKETYGKSKLPNVNYQELLLRINNRISSMENNGLNLPQAREGLKQLQRVLGLQEYLVTRSKSQLKRTIRLIVQLIYSHIRLNTNQTPAMETLMDLRKYDFENRLQLLPSGSYEHYWKAFYGSFNKTINDYIALQ